MLAVMANAGHSRNGRVAGSAGSCYQFADGGGAAGGDDHFQSGHQGQVVHADCPSIVVLVGFHP